jgi:hypothetical protein
METSTAAGDREILIQIVNSNDAPVTEQAVSLQKLRLDLAQELMRTTFLSQTVDNACLTIWINGLGMLLRP